MIWAPLWRSCNSGSLSCKSPTPSCLRKKTESFFQKNKKIIIIKKHKVSRKGRHKGFDALTNVLNAPKTSITLTKIKFFIIHSKSMLF
jgi:hypothetical protein